jgi:beta-lactam-binding protein with PASTA domain
MSAPLPPDDAETRIVPAPPLTTPPAAQPPGDPADYEPEPSRGLGWGMLLAILVLIAVAAAAAAVYFATRDNGNPGAATTTTTAPLTTTIKPVVVAATKVFVPDVTGLAQDAAVARLGQAHLVPVITFQPTKKPTGRVVGQDPKAAKRVAKGTNVMLVVDKGSPSVAVPDVTNLKVADASKQLTAAGFKTQTTQVTVPDKATGTVVSQAPAAGAKAAKGAAITLSVSTGGPTATATTATTTPAATTTTSGTATTPKPTTTAQPTTATVPDLSGTDVQAASQALIQANLRATLSYVPGTDPLGTVITQAPAAGGTAPAMSHVTVNASSGPNQNEQASVPNVVGQQLRQAVSTLNGAGLRLIFVKVPVTTRASVGKVVEQTPLAGKTAPKNAQVLVYLGVLRQG